MKPLRTPLPSTLPTMSCQQILLEMPCTWPLPPSTNVIFCLPGTVSIEPMPTSLAIFDVSIPSWASLFLPLSHHSHFLGRPQRYDRRSNDRRYTGSTAQNLCFRRP